MKKNGLFKILIILMVAILLLTWFVPAGYFSGEYVDSGILRLGFFDLCQYLILPFFQSMFLEVLIFILAVGAFYGVLSNIGAYRSWLEKIAKKLEKKGNLFLIITAFVFAALSSFGGYGLLLFIFIPAIISIILLMGYDKMTGLLVTFVAMLVGVIGTTYGADYISTNLSALSLTYNSHIYFKLGLFVLSFVALVFTTLKHVKKTKTSSSSKKAKEIKDTYLGEEVAPKTRIWPLITIFSVLFVLLVLGCTNWNEVFGIGLFANVHTAITSFSIKEYAIFSYILGNSASELGNWSYFQMAIMVFIASLVIGRIYKFKFNENLENIVDGIKKIIKPALLVTFAYGVLVLVVNTGVFTTLMSYLIDGVEKFNLLSSTLINIVGSALHVELSYVGNFYLPYLASAFAEEYAIAILNVSTQALYGLTMFVAPTSLFMILGLTYLDIPYKKWLKFSWKLVLEIFILIIIASIVLLLIFK